MQRQKTEQPGRSPAMFPTVAVVELGLGGLAWTVAWMVAYEGPADVVDRLTRPELLSRDLIWGIAATLPMFGHGVAC